MTGVSGGEQVASAGLRIAKRFGHVQALSDATVSVRAGEVVALFGDNGAGKSTFLRILQGIYRPDAGRVVIGGKLAALHSIRDAQLLGVDCVHQDLALAPDLSVVDAMFIGHELISGGLKGRLGAAGCDSGVAADRVRILGRWVAGLTGSVVAGPWRHVIDRAGDHRAGQAAGHDRLLDDQEGTGAGAA